MTTPVTLELPEHIAQQAQAVASQTQRPWEEVLLDWLTRAAAELPVEWLTDEQVLQCCDLQLAPQQQERLSDLLAAQRENELSEAERVELEALLQTYRQGMVRKAEAMKIAVERGLMTTQMHCKSGSFGSWQVGIHRHPINPPLTHDPPPPATPSQTTSPKPACIAASHQQRSPHTPPATASAPRPPQTAHAVESVGQRA